MIVFINVYEVDRVLLERARILIIILNWTHYIDMPDPTHVDPLMLTTSPNQLP